MRLIPVAAAAALLTSCATYSEIQSKAPILEVVSAKTAAEYAGCIFPRARELWRSTATIGPDGDRQVLTVAGDDTGVYATLTIAPEGAGSRVTYRGGAQLGKFRRFQDDIAACL